MTYDGGVANEAIENRGQMRDILWRRRYICRIEVGTSIGLRQWGPKSGCDETSGGPVLFDPDQAGC